MRAWAWLPPYFLLTVLETTFSSCPGHGARARNGCVHTNQANWTLRSRVLRSVPRPLASKNVLQLRCYLKVRYYTSFTGLYFASWTTVEQSHIINYPKKKKKLDKSPKTFFPALQDAKMLSFNFLMQRVEQTPGWRCCPSPGGDISALYDVTTSWFPKLCDLERTF